MHPSALSLELRETSGGHLPERRAVVVGSMVALGCMGLISLYQMGAIKHLPEPPIPGLDADKVDASPEAYGHLQMGDGFLGLGSYAATAALAAMGGSDRARTQPWIPLALAAKTTVDAAQAAKLTYDQFAKHKAACLWCLLATAATVSNLVFALPEAKRALRTVARR